MLYLRNVLFTILQPGLVAGLIPYYILRNTSPGCSSPTLTCLFGAIVFLVGLGIMLTCIYNFARIGKGTLSPADPTKKLVASGLYVYSRNPMYVGVILILIGEAIFFKSTPLWIYSLIVFILFHLFIVFFEEPRLSRDFGHEYQEYTQSVRRWI